ncbi:MAG: hypothetical protein ACOC8C_00865, partial [Chloroflexota bacterium]
DHAEVLWLRDASHPEEPLADRVETMVRQLLMERLVWLERDLINMVYARFPGVLTPLLELVQACIRSYGIQEGVEVRLRPEDDPERRRRQVEALREHLLVLGRRLGYRPAGGVTWDVRWLDDGQEAYLFAISVTGKAAVHLLRRQVPPSGPRRCLVVPGGRSELINLKLRWDPRLAQASRVGQWQFLKYRHLRRLVSEEGLDRRLFEAVLSLDPIAEREHQQLRLL